MNASRRDLLKLFGIGAAAVPIIGGLPDMNAAARIIEPPKIEPMELPSIDVSASDMSRLNASLINRERIMILVDIVRPNQERIRFNASAYMVSLGLGLPIDVATSMSERSSLMTYQRKFRPSTAEFTLKGTYTSDPTRDFNF